MSTIGPGTQKNACQNDAFQWNDPPSAPTINVPVSATPYSSIVTLDATVTDGASFDSVTDIVYARFEYDRSDNNWVAIRGTNGSLDGSTAASGNHSTLSWDISALQPGFNYRVRSLTLDYPWTQSSAYTTSPTFIVGPGFAGLFAVQDNFSRAAYRREVLADSPLGYWRLDETTGIITADTSGNGRVGQYNGGYTLGKPTLVDDGTAVLFNGTTGYVGIPHAGALSPTVAVTLEAWAIPQDLTAPSGHRMVFSLKDTAYVSFLLGASFSPFFSLEVAGVQRSVNSNYVGVAQKKHHIVATYDGATMRIYVDAVERNTFPIVGAMTLGAVEKRIADYVAAPLIYPFNGTIDEVALYGTALSPARIQAHYDMAQMSARYRAESNTTGYYASNNTLSYRAEKN